MRRTFARTTLSDVIGGSILVVEDDTDLRTTIAEVLGNEGYTVTMAANGADALAFLRRAEAPRPRLILLDLVMPVLGGREFHQQLQKEAGSDIPVVILSGDAAVKDKAADLGASGGLRKPISLSSLLEIVRRLV